MNHLQYRVVSTRGTRTGWTLLSICLGGLIVCQAALGAGRYYDVRDYGAQPNAKDLCTAAIQKAIDVATASGGGTVYLPAGTFRSGALYLKSNTVLWLEAGCTLLGSPHGKDYPRNRPKLRSYTDQYVEQSLISGEGLEHVGICGHGTIDGNGAAFAGLSYLNRPYIVRLVSCRDVRVEGIRLQNSPMWTQHYLACDQVRLRDVTVFGHVNDNNDGVDIDACHDVSITGCVMDTGDDAVCLKSTLDRACRHVAVSNCILSSRCSAFKLGTESNGGFEDIVVSNCVLCSPRLRPNGIGNAQGISGISLETVDGAPMDRVTISNVTIRGVSVPIFVRLGNRARPFTQDGPKPAVGTMRNVLLSNIVATGANPTGCAIAGIPGHCIENLTLRDIHLSFAGGGAKGLVSRELPEHEAKYPEASMFGTLPAYGLYCRHVRGLNLHGVRLETASPDGRHALVCDDVKDLVIDDLNAQGAPTAAALIRMHEVEQAFVRNCRLRTSVGVFLSLEGPSTRHILLTGCDLSQAATLARFAAGTPERALLPPGNCLPEKR